MREVGINNWKLVPLLSFTCDRNTILEFEKDWCKALGSDLNTYTLFTGLDKEGYMTNYYSLNREYILQRQANYNAINREIIRQKQAQYNHSNVQNKIHHCDVCDKSFTCNANLQKHFDTLKHQYAYLNSLD